MCLPKVGRLLSVALLRVKLLIHLREERELVFDEAGSG